MDNAAPTVNTMLPGASHPVRAGFPETVPVGNPGNPADSTGYGAVAYSDLWTALHFDHRNRWQMHARL